MSACTEIYSNHNTPSRKSVHKRLMSESVLTSLSPHGMTSLLDGAVRSGYFWKKTRPKSMEHIPTHSVIVRLNKVYTHR